MYAAAPSVCKRDGGAHHIRDAIEALASQFALTDSERSELIPGGKKFKFDDRVQWANTYLKKAGILESVGRGIFQVTERGLSVLEANPESIDANYLMQFPEFKKFKSRDAQHDTEDVMGISDQEIRQTPQELLQASYRTLRDELAQDLLDTILSCPPNFFERLVVDLLLALGYGGAIENAGNVTGLSVQGGS